MLPLPPGLSSAVQRGHTCHSWAVKPSSLEGPVAPNAEAFRQQSAPDCNSHRVAPAVHAAILADHTLHSNPLTLNFSKCLALTLHWMQCATVVPHTTLHSSYTDLIQEHICPHYILQSPVQRFNVLTLLPLTQPVSPLGCRQGS